MMAAGLNFNSIVDLGFVLLVTAVCIRSLTSNSLDAEKVAGRWRSELRELERVLRDLITEAGSASASLDRRLMKRKTELEALLNRFETGEAPGAKAPTRAQSRTGASPAARPAAKPQPKAAPKPAAREDREWQLGDIDELPNDSWGSAPARAAMHEEDEEEESESTDLGHLEDLIESASDTLELSAQISRQAAQARVEQPRSAAPAVKPAPKPAAKPASRTLSTQIEKIRVTPKPEPQPAEQAPEGEIEENDEIFKQLSIMDPTAYKIARRLLAAGTEIHVVARKLDLPVSEIRLMDRLMREEGQARQKALEVGPNYKPTETVPRKKIVRERSTGAPERRITESEERAAGAEETYVELSEEAAEPVMTEEMIDRIIERELALL